MPVPNHKEAAEAHRALIKKADPPEGETSQHAEDSGDYHLFVTTGMHGRPHHPRHGYHVSRHSDKKEAESKAKHMNDRLAETTGGVAHVKHTKDLGDWAPPESSQHAEEEHYPQLAAKHGYGEPKWYKGMSTYVHPDGHAFVVNQKGKWTHSSNKAEHSSGNSPNELSHHLSKFHGEGSQHSEVDGQPNHVTAQDAEALFASNPVIKK